MKVLTPHFSSKISYLAHCGVPLPGKKDESGVRLRFFAVPADKMLTHLIGFCDHVCGQSARPTFMAHRQEGEVANTSKVPSWLFLLGG